MITGRFAPTPSGPLHMGSLVAALASYLDVRRRGGRWLVRIEDVDVSRARPEFESSILFELERHGLHWDGAVVRQSERSEYYADVLEHLRSQGLLYYCRCSRSSLRNRGCLENQQGELIYPGFCRPSLMTSEPAERLVPPGSQRLLLRESDYSFHDELCGPQSGSVSLEAGDFVLRRHDGCFTYHLAVVVDDFLQNVTRVVRGLDILPLTGRHILLQRALGYPTPQYAHIPLVYDVDGHKLSKSRSAQAIARSSAEENLVVALGYLGLNLKMGDFSSVSEIIHHCERSYQFT